MLRQAFVSLPPRFATLVLWDCLLKLFHCVRQAECRIGSFVGVAEVQP